MNTKTNKTAVRELYAELMGKGNSTAADLLLDKAYVDHNIPGMLEDGGREELKAAVHGVRGAFPDIKPQLHEIIAEGDWVSVRVVAEGTHTGSEFMGVKPLGRKMRWDEIHHFRVVGGRIVEHHGIFDMLSIMKQIGALG